MILKFKFPIILFLCGFLVTIVGAWAKIIHLAFADGTLIAGMLLQGAGVAYSIYILIRSK